MVIGNNKEIKAEIALLLMVFSWGISYLMIGVCLEEIGVATLNSIRFIIGFIVVAIFAKKRMHNPNKETLLASFLMSILVTFIYYTATVAVKYTPITNIGFLTGLTVIFVPILEFVFNKVHIEKKLRVVILMCIAGTGLMTLNKNFDINKEYFFGNMVCIINALASALKAILTCKFVKKEKVDAYQFGMYLLGFTGLWNLLITVTTEELELPNSTKVWAAVLFLAIVCTGANFLIQAIAMQYTTPTKVGVIFSLEQVFIAVAAFLFIHEVLTMRAYFGAGIIFLGTIIMEVDIKKLYTKLVERRVRKTGNRYSKEN